MLSGKPCMITNKKTTIVMILVILVSHSIIWDFQLLTNLIYYLLHSYIAVTQSTAAYTREPITLQTATYKERLGTLQKLQRQAIVWYWKNEQNSKQTYKEARAHPIILRSISIVLKICSRLLCICSNYLSVSVWWDEYFECSHPRAETKADQNLEVNLGSQS